MNFAAVFHFERIRNQILADLEKGFQENGTKQLVEVTVYHSGENMAQPQTAHDARPDNNTGRDMSSQTANAILQKAINGLNPAPDCETRNSLPAVPNRRVKKCLKCSTHRFESHILRGIDCPFNSCICKLCKKTDRKRITSALFNQRRRDELRNNQNNS